MRKHKPKYDSAYHLNRDGLQIDKKTAYWETPRYTDNEPRVYKEDPRNNPFFIFHSVGAGNKDKTKEYINKNTLCSEIYQHGVLIKKVITNLVGEVIEEICYTKVTL